MKIGNIHFNIEELKDIKEADFKAQFAGKLNIDINEAWKELKAAVKKLK